jgi:hypothetical protein
VQCPNCSQSDRVTIGNKDYCTNCGTSIDKTAGVSAAAATVQPATPVPTQPSPAPIVQPQTTVNSTPTAAVAPVAAAAPIAPAAPAPAPIATAAAPEPIIAPTPTPAAVVATPDVPEPTQKPAQQFHARPVTSANVLDLRQNEAPAQPIAPAAQISKSRVQARAEIANQTPKSSLIQKFTLGRKPEAAPATPTATSAADAKPDLAAIAASINQPAPTPSPAVGRTLPNAVATQIAAMNTPAPSVAGTGGLPAAAKPASIVAGVVAFVVMAGYIWMQNYPRMALRLASNKAGFSAVMPSYLPSSYNLEGPIAYAPGQVVINFNSASDNSKLVLAERKTDWDSSSLLENYVARKTKDYLAVENQGLTVYLYNGNQASWVNRGVWYTIEGQNNLNRDQVLKIASSL